MLIHNFPFFNIILFNIKNFKKSKDLFSKYLISAILIITTIQVIINISVSVGLMPTKGVPLPLISYGGSSLVFTLGSLGLILGLDKRRK